LAEALDHRGVGWRRFHSWHREDALVGDRQILPSGLQDAKSGMYGGRDYQARAGYPLWFGSDFPDAGACLMDFRKLPSSRVVRAIWAETPAELGLIMGFAAVFENIYPPDALNKKYWVAGFVIATLVILISLIVKSYREEHRAEKERTQRETLAAEAEVRRTNEIQTLLRRFDRIEIIIASDKTAAEKVEDIKQQVLILSAAYEVAQPTLTGIATVVREI
jgi:hypothetical protein